MEEKEEFEEIFKEIVLIKNKAYNLYIKISKIVDDENDYKLVLLFKLFSSISFVVTNMQLIDNVFRKNSKDDIIDLFGCKSEIIIQDNMYFDNYKLFIVNNFYFAFDHFSKHNKNFEKSFWKLTKNNSAIYILKTLRNMLHNNGYHNHKSFNHVIGEIEYIFEKEQINRNYSWTDILNLLHHSIIELEQFFENSKNLVNSLDVAIQKIKFGDIDSSEIVLNYLKKLHN